MHDVDFVTNPNRDVRLIGEESAPFLPKDDHCGLWHEFPNKDQHASFGADGTTASANCYGEIIQVSQFLGVGSSGVFSLDHEPTAEPWVLRIIDTADLVELTISSSYNVRSRAKDLHDYCLNPSDGLTFGVLLSDSLEPQDALDMRCRWVNWRWPRFDYTPLGSEGVKASYQYMVHDGIMLQQFVVDNTNGNEAFEFVCGFVSGHKIRDLDFVEHPKEFNDKNREHWHTSGPHGYSLVSLNPMYSTTEDTNTKTFKHVHHGVASVIAVFENGRAAKMEAKKTKHCDDWRVLDVGNTFQLVVAYKFVSISDLASATWEDFTISADATNINQFLDEETNRLNMTTTVLSLGITLFDSEKVEGILSGVGQTSGTTGSTGSTGTRDKVVRDGVISPPRSVPEYSGTNPRSHFEYLAWRHLEHILSVCAMPFYVSARDEGSELLSRLTKNRECESGDKSRFENLPFVALTCGDMSGHRIITSTSYFTFVYLIRMARRLEACQKQLGQKLPYVSDLQIRISVVLRGHIRWLQRVRMISQSENGSEHTKLNFKNEFEEETSLSRLLRSGCFAANYWVTGEMILREGDTWQPRNMITDTAFQILKLTEMYSHVGQDNSHGMDKNYQDLGEQTCRDRAETLRMIEDTYVPWVFKLHVIDHRENFAWPHTDTEGFNKFRLDDQFWIWKTLRALEVAKVTSRHLQASKSTLSKPGKPDEQWTALETQWINFLLKAEHKCDKFKLILQRLEASNVQRRVLQRFTTENSVSRRRMLAVTKSPRESRYMLHARDMALFYDRDCASFLTGSSNTQLWLRTVEAQAYHEGNQFTNWDGTLRYALSLAMGIKEKTVNDTSPDELVTKSTNVLLNCSGFSGFFSGMLDAGTKEPSLFQNEKERDRYYHASFEINLLLLENAGKISAVFERVSLRATDITAASTNESSGKKSPPSEEILSKILVRLEGIPFRPEVEARPKMEKSIASINALDANQITLIDEEWLYNYPEFLLGHEVNDKDVLDSKAMVKNQKFRACHTETKGIVAFVLDVPRQKHQGKRHEREPAKEKRFLDNESLRGHLQEPRTSEKSKKRLLWLTRADENTYVNCLAATPNMDRRALSDFFDHHDRFTKDVWDRVDCVFNTWQTRLHLSFYILTEWSEYPTESSLGWTMKTMRTMPRDPGLTIRRASMSFHFSGDAFDRYWTCHAIDNIPWSPTSFSELFDLGNQSLIQSFLQRKVLELHLLSRILQLVALQAKKVLAEVKAELQIDENTTPASQLVRTSDLRSTADWYQFEDILQLVGEDLTSSLKVLDRWNLRAEARGMQQPRWTHNDEKKYRRALIDFQTMNDRRIGKIQWCRDQILKLKDDISTSRETIRDDLEFDGNQTIQYFTYVTIIFLPLGFATSVYSMSGPPDPAFLRPLIKFMAASFGVTFVLLFIFVSVMKFTIDPVRLFLSMRNAFRTHFRGFNRRPQSTSKSADDDSDMA